MRYDLSDNLNYAVQKVLNKYIKIALKEIRHFWAIYGKLPGDEAIENRKTEPSKNPKIGIMQYEITQNLVKATIVAEGRKAWIIEFGRGSMMETSQLENPYLAEYISDSSLFNTARLSKGYAILGREKGYHNDLDGGTFFSSGRARGRDIEQWRIKHKYSGRRNGTAPVRLFDYSPIMPTHVIRHTLFESGLIEEMTDKMSEAICDVIFDEMRKNVPKEMLFKL